MAQPAADSAFSDHMRQLDGLLEEVRGIADRPERERAHRLIQGLVEFHGAALERILEHLDGAGDAGRNVIEELCGDELVANLLLLHGLHPVDLETRVRSALEKVRPYLGSHGGNVELLEVSDDGAVRLQMQGSCHGCPSSAITLKTSIERAIYESAPDVTSIDVLGVEAPPAPKDAGFVPLGQLLSHVPARPLAQGAPS